MAIVVAMTTKIVIMTAVAIIIAVLKVKETGDHESTMPFDNIMKQVPLEFIFPVKGQSLASSGLSAYQIQ